MSWRLGAWLSAAFVLSMLVVLCSMFVALAASTVDQRGLAIGGIIAGLTVMFACFQNAINRVPITSYKHQSRKRKDSYGVTEF